MPTFLLALMMVAGSDLLAAVPRNLVDVHGERLGIATAELPIATGELDPAYVVASQAALLDAGVAWLFSMFEPETRADPAIDRARVSVRKRARKPASS